MLALRLTYVLDFHLVRLNSYLSFYLQSDAILLESQQIAEQIRPLEELELEVVVRLGISAEDIDPVQILLEVKKKASHDAYYALILRSLRELHRLRRQYSRAQRKLPVDLKICPSPPGVSRRQLSYPIITNQSHFRTHTVSTPPDSGLSSLVSMSMHPIRCVVVYRTYS